MGKFYDHKIKYRTLDQLLSTVADDLPLHDKEGYIDKSQLIKIVRKVNKQLGLRITKTKEKLISFSNWLINLPEDLENINFLILCTYIKTSVPAIQGTITEHVDVDCEENGNTVYVTKCGDVFQIIEKTLPNIENVYRIQKRVNIKHSEFQVCPGEIAAVILNDNFLKITENSGKIYLNYEGVLEDKERNLLVIDHPLLNDYYEYSIKERILENMYFAGEDVERKLAYIQPKLRAAKQEAYTVANMPEFKELEEISEINRQAMFIKYFSIFQ